MKKSLPSLCFDKSTGWFHSVIPDPSKPSRRTKHTWSKDKDEAQRLYDAGIIALCAEFAKRQPISITPASAWSLAELSDHYFAHKVSMGRTVGYLNSIRRYVKPFSDFLKANGVEPKLRKPSELDSAILSAYWQKLAQNVNISRKEANHRVSHVRMLLLWGNKTHGITIPPLGALSTFGKKAKVGHGRKQDKTQLTWDIVNRLLSFADPVDKATIMLTLNTGMGQTDLATLLLTEVDLEAGTISNTRRKTGADRDFCLWPETVTVLREYLSKHRGKHPRQQAEGLFFVGRKGMPLVWDTLIGKKYKHVDAIKCRWDRLLKRAGIKARYGLGYYSLRHFFATQVGLRSIDPAEVQAAMGHLTLDMQTVYRHDRKLKAATAIDRLGEAVRKNLPSISQTGSPPGSGSPTPAAS